MTTAPRDAAPFDLRVERQRNGRLRLWLSGDIDAPERDRIITALDHGATPAEIYIDMRSLRFMGSAGLSALIHAVRLLEPVDERVVLLDPPANVVMVLDTHGITNQFAIQLTGRPTTPHI